MGEDINTINKGQRTRESERLGGKKTINERSFSRAVNRWAQMTEDNRHSEVRQSIAKYFKYDDLEKEYKAINKEHNRVGYLDANLSERRRKNDEKLYKRIRKDYGEKTYKRVYGSL